MYVRLDVAGFIEQPIASADDRLRNLLDEREIHQVLMRYCRGCDRGDEDSLRSVVHPDAVFERGPQSWYWVDDIVADLLQRTPDLGKPQPPCDNLAFGSGLGGLMSTPRATCAAFAILLLSACGTATNSPASSSARYVSGGEITSRLTADWTGFDPQNIASGNASGVISGVYDRLVSLSADIKLVPYLAKSWKSSPTSIQFTLRSDVTCSDGTKLTPTDVAKSFQRLIDKKLVAPSLWGPGPYTVSADDAASTFTLSLGTPWSDAIYGFANTSASVLCPAAINGDAASKPVGTGLYTLESAIHGDRQVLKKRPGWNWGPGGMNSSTPGLPDTITFEVIASDTTAANLLLQGQLNIAVITGPDVTRLQNAKSLTHQVGISTYTYPLAFNEFPGHPTADDRVREALMTAVDPQAFARAAFGAGAPTSPSFLTSSAHCFDAGVAKYLPKPSISQARSILVADGYTADSNGKLQKDGKLLRIRLNATSSVWGHGPEYIAAQWTQVGVTVDFTDLDYTTWAINGRQGNFDANIVNTTSATPATGSFIGYLTGPTPNQSGTNYAYNIDPTLVGMIASAEASVGDASCRIWSGVQARMLTQHHMLPLASAEYQWFGNGAAIEPTVFLSGNPITISLRRTGG